MLVTCCRGVARIFQRGGHTVSNIVMAFSPRNIVHLVVCLKKGLQRGGHGHPRTSLATPLCCTCTVYSVCKVSNRPAE